MSALTSENIRSKIQQFLEDNYAAKQAAHEKKPIKDLTSYEPKRWIADKALSFAKQLRFGTHISRGVHPSSNGNTVFFAHREIEKSIVGSQHLLKTKIDASGNAAALPLIKFFTLIIDEEAQLTLQDLILSHHPALDGVFDDNPEKSKEYQEHFYHALSAQNQVIQTDELNKQLLWPLSDEITKDEYITLIPLHPSALVNNIYERVQQTRTKKKQAKEELLPYSQFSQLVRLKIGGENSQNVSALNSKQGGINFLLPSLPPQYEARSHLNKSDSNIFNYQFKKDCEEALKQISACILEAKNNLQVREQRKAAEDEMIGRIFFIAQAFIELPADWSADYPRLERSQRIWLDQRYFAETSREIWLNIANQFAHWIVQQLQHKHQALASELSSAERRYFKNRLFDELIDFARYHNRSIS